jgi:hypothetical protein
MRWIHLEPVRLYAIATAVMGVVAHYNPDIPTALWLMLVGAVLGIGEAVRAKVVPLADVVIFEDIVGATFEALEGEVLE